MKRPRQEVSGSPLAPHPSPLAFDVFHIDGERGLRGGERQLLYLATALRKRGHRNVVVCRRGSPLAQEARKMNFELLHLPFLGEFDPISAWTLRRAAQQSQKPILHAHTAHAAGLTALASWPKRFPIVAHRRVDFPLRGRLSRSFKYGRADHVIAVSEAIGSILKESGIASERISVVPDSVPVGETEAALSGRGANAFSPAKAEDKSRMRQPLAESFGIPIDVPWVGNLAALVPHKDHDTLIAAAFLVAAQHPSVVFVIAGQGPEEARLLAQIRRMNLGGKVFLIGHVADAASFLKSLDLFVLSSWGEGMGSVLLEASACAVPIAATRAGGISEIIEDGATGLLSPPRSPEKLAANIVKLLENPKIAAELAQAGLKRAKLFSIDQMAQKTEKVYEEVTAVRERARQQRLS